jgi:hypothetical protein
MRHFKAASVIAVLATVALSPAAQAQVQTFAGGLNENMQWTSTGSGTGLLNFGPGTNVDKIDLGDYLGQGLGTYNVIEQINGGAGVATTGLTSTGNGNYYFDFTQNVTISYVFATPVVIDGVSVTNLLTVTVDNAQFNNEFDLSATTAAGRQHVKGSWTFDSGFGGVTFSSDLLKFLNVVDEGGGLSFSGVSYVGTGTPTKVTFSGNSNYASDPLPEVPEPLSAALLVVGMTAVGVASRRRRGA